MASLLSSWDPRERIRWPLVISAPGWQQEWRDRQRDAASPLRQPARRETPIPATQMNQIAGIPGSLIQQLG